MSKFPLFSESCVPARPDEATAALTPLYRVAEASKGKITQRIFDLFVGMLKTPNPSLTEVVAQSMEKMKVPVTSPYHQASIVTALQAHIKLNNKKDAIKRLQAPIMTFASMAADLDVPVEEKAEVLFAILKQEIGKERGHALERTASTAEHVLTESGASQVQTKNLANILHMYSQEEPHSAETEIHKVGRDALAVAPQIPVPATRKDVIPGAWQIHRHVKLLTDAAKSVVSEPILDHGLTMSPMDI